MRKYESKLRIKLFFTIVVSFISIIFVSGGVVSAESTKPPAWSWSDDYAQVYSSEEIVSITPGGCDGVLQNVKIFPLLENRDVCIKNSNGLKIGYYLVYGVITRYVVSYPLDSVFYEVSFPCSYVNECLYVPGSDSLIMKQNLINGYVKSLVIYKNVSQRIKLTLGSALEFKYRFDADVPDYVFKSEEGYAWPIGNFSSSDNGRWLAIELRERGVGLLDLKTMVMKRITSERLRYGYGYDPTTELAVSNSGEQVVQMGANSGLSFYDLTTECGAVANDETMWLDYVKNPCRKVGIDFEKFIHRFLTGHYPKFSNDGAELSFFASSYSENPRKVVLRAKNFTPQRLDYLAMGDSFTSGEGEFDDRYYLKGTNTEFEKCHVSSRSYPFQIATLSGLDTQFVKSVACSGARTVDIVSDVKEYLGQGNRLGKDGLNLNPSERELAQIYAKYNFLQGRVLQKEFAEQFQPDIISIGIGGNDVGLVGKLQSCIGPDICSFAIDEDAKAQVSKEIKSQYNKLVETYGALHKLSPNSKIFVVGYPKVVSEFGSCGLVLGNLLSIEERVFFNESIKYLNQIIESAAKTVGVRYVDNFNSLGDGVICGSSSEKAINDFRLGDDIGIVDKYKWTRIIGAESFHPNPKGFNMIATNFLDIIGDIDTAEVCSDGGKLCPVQTPAPEPSSYWKSTNNGLPLLVSEDFVDSYDIQSGSISRSLHLESFSLRPNIPVKVYLYSEKTFIGEYFANEDGSFDQEIILPESLEYGFHTIHINGESYSGENIELYQSIYYFDEREVPTVNEKEAPKYANDSINTVEYPTTLGETTLTEDYKDGSDVSNYFSESVKGAVDKKLKNPELVDIDEDKYLSVIMISLSIFISVVGGWLLIRWIRNRA